MSDLLDLVNELSASEKKDLVKVLMKEASLMNIILLEDKLKEIKKEKLKEKKILAEKSEKTKEEIDKECQFRKNTKGRYYWFLLTHNSKKDFVLYPKHKKRLKNMVNNTCACCGERFASSALHVHHINFRQHGGKNNIENLSVLCSNCHNTLHNYFYDNNILKKNTVIQSDSFLLNFYNVKNIRQMIATTSQKNCLVVQ